MLSFFPRGVLDEILNLIKSVSEDFPSYSYEQRKTHGSCAAHHIQHIRCSQQNKMYSRSKELSRRGTHAERSTFALCICHEASILYNGRKGVLLHFPGVVGKITGLGRQPVSIYRYCLTRKLAFREVAKRRCDKEK